jgi:hypothetical protein
MVTVDQLQQLPCAGSSADLSTRQNQALAPPANTARHLHKSDDPVNDSLVGGKLS